MASNKVISVFLIKKIELTYQVVPTLELMNCARNNHRQDRRAIETQWCWVTPSRTA